MLLHSVQTAQLNTTALVESESLKAFVYLLPAKCQLSEENCERQLAACQPWAGQRLYEEAKVVMVVMLT